MASTDLIPTTTLDKIDSGSIDSTQAAPLIHRPADLVELAEAVYRGIFGAGLVVAAIATLNAVALGVLQPAGQRAIGIAVCTVLVLAQLLAIRQRRRLYASLRRWPWFVLAPAAAIGIGAWATGTHNQQLFYVLTIAIGVCGVAVPLRVVAAASLVAAAGMAVPHISDGSWAIGIAVAAGIVPPLFWLVVEQLARFMLRLHAADQQPPRRPKRVRAWVERTPAAPTSTTAGDTHNADGNEGDGRERARHPDLTARQLEVLLLCAEGLTNREIASCLQIGAVQVGRHLSHARKSAGVATNAELVAWAVGYGLIPRAQPGPVEVSERDPQN